MAESGRREGLSTSLIAGSEKLYGFYCQPCSHDNQHLPAEGYCVDCKEYLCGTCFKCHRKLSAVRHHVLIDRNKMPWDKLLTKKNVKDVCTHQCPDHQGKAIEYYCKQHDQLECSACMTINHRGCKGDSHIPNIACGIEKTKYFIHLKQKLNDLEQTVKKNETNANENTSLVETISNEATSEIGKFINEIKDLFDALKNVMTDEVKVIRDEDMATMNFISDECDSIRSYITSMTSDLDRRQKSKQNSQLFVTIKTAEKEIKLIEDKLNRINAENKVTQYKFVPEKQITDLITKLKQLGRLSLCQEEAPPQIEGSTTLSMQQETALDISRTSKASSADPRNPSQIKNKDGIIAQVSLALGVPKVSEAQSNTLINEAKHIEAHHIKDINVNSDTDKKTPDIVGLALLHDGRLAAADFSNRCIKIIDIENYKITSHKTSTKPWDITEVYNDQVAFTCDNNIIVLTVSKTPYISRVIRVDGLCAGIQCHQGRLIVSFRGPIKVEIMETNGTVIQRLTPHCSGETWSPSIDYLTVSPDGNTIYVSDNWNKKVVSQTLEGQVKHMCSINSPRGLDSDKYGLVYVCGYNSNSVTVLTPDLNQAQELLGDRDGIIHPYSIAYCGKEDKLYVGMDDSNFVKVFQLK